MEMGQILAAIGAVTLIVLLVVYFMQKSSPSPSPVVVVTPGPKSPTSTGNSTIDFLNYFW